MQAPPGTTREDSDPARQDEAAQDIPAEVEWLVNERTQELQAEVDVLRRENAELKQAGEALKEAYTELDARVRERTAELGCSNTRLLAEIGERERTEVVLREGEARYQALFDSIDEGFCIIEMIFDAAGKPIDYRFLETNRAFEKQTGMHGAAGKRMREFVPNHEEHWFEIYGEIATTGKPKRFTRAAKPLMGGWYDVYAFPVGARNSNRVAILFKDITEAKLAEDRLRRGRDRLALALDAIQAGVSFWDIKNDRTEWNPRQFELLGYGPGTVEPGPAALLDRVHPGDRERVTAELERSIRAREDYVTDYRICLPGGEEHWVHSIRRFAYDADGRAVSSHGIMYDITDRKHHEAIRQQAYDQIEHNMEQFAILGDHVRHPLQVILARADLMEDGETAASIREQVRRINEIVRQLDRGWVESHAIREFLRRNDLG